MTRAIDRLAHLADAADDTRRRLVVHDADGFDRVLAILLEAVLDGGRIGAVAPIGRNELGPQAELDGHLSP